MQIKKLTNKALFYKYLGLLFYHSFFLLAAVSRHKVCSDVSKPSLHTTDILFNKNYNNTTIGSSGITDNHLIDYESYYYRAVQFFMIGKCRLSELLKKFHFLHEESNYYPFLGQTDPGSTFRKRRISSAFHRV